MLSNTVMPIPCDGSTEAAIEHTTVHKLTPIKQCRTTGKRRKNIKSKPLAARPASRAAL